MGCSFAEVLIQIKLTESPFMVEFTYFPFKYYVFDFIFTFDI